MAQQAVCQEQETPITQDPVFLNTVWGAVAVYGHHLVSKKDLVILGHCLSLPDFGADEGDHGVRMVMFRDDNRPVEMKRRKLKDSKKYESVAVPLMASCIPDAQAIVINLEQTFIVAAEEAEGEDEHSSLKACFHRNLILNYLHEIHHMEKLFKIGMAGMDDATKAELETLAQEWSLEQLFELAKTVDIEPAHHAESAYLSKALMALLMEETDEWSKKQRHMLENNIMYELPEEKDKHDGLCLMSFKAVCQLMSGDDPDDEKWKQDTIPHSTAELSAAVDQAVKKNNISETQPNNPVGMGSCADAEALEIPDPGFEYEVGDPNMMGFGMNGNGGSFEEEYQQPQYVDTNSAVVTTPTPDAAINNLMQQFPIAGGQQPVVNGQQPVIVNPQPGQTIGLVQPVNQVTAQTTPAVRVYPQTGLTPEQTRDVVFGVFNKIYNHIFSQCGRMLNSDRGFSNPEKVAEIAIPLTEQEKAVVVKCDCLDINGRWCPNMPTVDGLRGFIMKNSKLPAYKIYVNNDGFEAIRLLLPQNPAKRTAGGQYSKPAELTRNGSCIMYVMDGEDKTDYNNKGKFFFKCVDNVWQAC